MEDFFARAKALDESDPLARFRTEFANPGRLIYFDGNSLGKMPNRAAEILQDVAVRQWASRLIRSWGEGWYTLPQRLGAKIATLIGAHEDEVLVADSTSVNFFKLAIAALQARPDRETIVSDDLNFPSDLYLLQGCAHLLAQRKVALARSQDELSVDPVFIEALLDRDTALLTLSHASFKSGFVHDMSRLTRAADDVGALTLWDLSHSVGAMPIDLGASGVHLAVGCCYKYLNGGPGAPAFLYVRRELQEELRSPIWGWFGQERPFDFQLDYEPAAGISRFFAGTPPILSIAAIEPGLDLLNEAGMERIRAKSVAQTELLIELFDEVLAPLGFSLGSPRDPAARGSHISIRHPEAYGIDRALIDEFDVVPDFRRPNHIRLGVSPLYTSYAEIAEGMDRIRRCVDQSAYTKFVGLDLPIT